MRRSRTRRTATGLLIVRDLVDVYWRGPASVEAFVREALIVGAWTPELWTPLRLCATNFEPDQIAAIWLVLGEHGDFLERCGLKAVP